MLLTRDLIAMTIN